ncbi:sugar ABC transporter substrate-binding protein [Spirochaetia bacterium]|nr:sugar ABC transporter substrate-binding protein [Spirochaetia bacterium]
MKSSKIFGFMVAVLMLPTALFGGGGQQNQGKSGGQPAQAVKPAGFPIVDEKLTLTVFGSRDQNQAKWSDMYFFKKYAELTNIDLDLQEVPAQGFEEKKNLLFASNELPDVFIRAGISPIQFSMYGAGSKQLLALDPYLEKWAPNINKILKENEAVRMAVTASDGHIYVLPELDFSDTGSMGFKQWINKGWLDAVGKKVPTTPQELRDVLIAFRDRDPNKNGKADEIPLGIREISSIYVLGGSWGLDHQMKDTINIKNGKLHYWIADNAFKEYLTFLHDLYANKLLWQNYYKADSRPEWRSNLSNALFGAFYMPYSDVFINVEDQFIGYPPLKGPYGDQLWADANNGVLAVGAFAVSSTCKNPEAALRWVDYLYSAEGSVFYRYGVEGETFTRDGSGMPRINNDIINSPEGFMTALGKINLVPGGGGPQMITNQTDGIVASDLTKKISAELAPYRPKVIYNKPTLNETDMDRVNAITQDLDKYRDESVTKFIIGEWGFEKWDEYCRTLERIGLPELEAIYQRAFDALRK